MQCLVGAVWSLRRTSKVFGFAQLNMGGKKMVTEFIKFHLMCWVQRMTILELNKLKKEIDRIISNQCDMLLEEASDDMAYIEPLDDSKVYYRELTHPSDM